MARRKHIVMIVTNQVIGDSRVLKSAQSAAQAGYEVTVIGSSPPGKPDELEIGDATVLRVPVQALLRRRFSNERRQASSRSRFSRSVNPAAALELRRLRRRTRIAALRVRINGLGRSRAAAALRGWLWLRILLTRLLIRLDRAIHDRVSGLGNPPRLMERFRRLDWRKELPTILDFERAFAPLINRLRPDLIHAHDMSTLAIAERAMTLLRAEGCAVDLVYDAHEYVRGLPHLPPRQLAAYIELEREFIGSAGAVITVSPAIARRLHREHPLPNRPAVVLNAPIANAFDPESKLSIREAAGLPAGVPLLVYSGTVKAQRGIDVLIRALAYLDRIHCAIVAQSSTSPGVVDALALAQQVGCEDRVHIVPYVDQQEVTTYLRTADVGVHPLLPSGNAGVALPNKLFEYLHASLPVVVSDLPAMRKAVQELGIGETFTPRDPASLADACERVLADPERYRAATRDPDVRARYSWEAQEVILLGVYRKLIGAPHAPGETRTETGSPVAQLVQ